MKGDVSTMVLAIEECLCALAVLVLLTLNEDEPGEVPILAVGVWFRFELPSALLATRFFAWPLAAGRPLGGLELAWLCEWFGLGDAPLAGVFGVFGVVGVLAVVGGVGVFGVLEPLGGRLCAVLGGVGVPGLLPGLWPGFGPGLLPLRL